MRPGRMSGGCFNPCSFGCQSESALRVRLAHGDDRVSILVLLDVSLKVRGKDRIRAGVKRFQSLFFWMSV